MDPKLVQHVGVDISEDMEGPDSGSIAGIWESAPEFFFELWLFEICFL